MVSKITTNNPPNANRDRLRAVANWPVVGKILDDDIDPDGDKLKIISVTSSTKNDGSVIKNKNDTVTFLPATNFVGIDSLAIPDLMAKVKLIRQKFHLVDTIVGAKIHQEG